MYRIFFKIVVPALSFFWAVHSYGQQQGQYSQYMMNYFLINPAAGGTEDYADIKTSFRQQWTGIQGAPQNYYLTAHTPLNKVHGRHDKKFSNKMDRPHHFIGASVNGQRLGALARHSLYASYGYYLPLTRQWSLSMSASAGMIQYNLNPNRLNFGDDITDPAVGYFNGVQPDMGAGIWLSSDKFFTGISTTQLLTSKMGFSGALRNHLYATAGYSVRLNRDWSFIPSVLVKTVPFSALQVDLNAKIRFQKIWWAGLSYRKSDALVLLTGINLKNTLEVGYSYDLTTSGLSNYTKGSHEIMLGVKLATKAKVISPSDFW